MHGTAYACCTKQLLDCISCLTASEPQLHHLCIYQLGNLKAGIYEKYNLAHTLGPSVEAGVQIDVLQLDLTKLHARPACRAGYPEEHH